MWNYTLKFSPGNEYFWVRATGCFMSDVFMQFLRGFVVEGSLATTSAGFTIAQTALIIVHTWVFLYTVYEGSETMYFFTQFIIEFGYLTIRVSLQGALSMATTDFLDFLTLAVPLFWMCFEVLEISNFILDHNPKDNRSNSRSLKCGLISIGTVVSAIGGVAIGICVYKGFIQGCPSVDPTERIDLVESEALFGEIYRLQHGVFADAFCYAWVFNMWLSPGCSCFYLKLDPFVVPENQTADSVVCAGLAGNNHTAIKPFFPYLEHLRFLYVAGHRINNDADTINCHGYREQDFHLIASWTYLRVLRWTGFPTQSLGVSGSVTFRTAPWQNGTIPPAWESLKDLVSIDLSYSGTKTLDQAIFDSWPLLESFVCVGCPQLENIHALENATLPRLRNVEVYGIQECITLSDEVDLTCVGREDPPKPTCKGIPEWYLRGFLDLAGQTKTTQCTQPACSQYFEDFDDLDKDGNGVLDSREFALMNYNRGVTMANADIIEDWHNEQIECSAREIEKVIPFPTKSGGYEVSDGWPMATFLAADLRYTMCTNCPQFQEEFDRRYAKYLQLKQAMASSGMTEECVAVAQGGIPFEAVEAACTTSRTDCEPGLCMFVSSMVGGDLDLDLTMTISEVELVAGPFGLGGVLSNMKQVYECMYKHSPSCLDTQNGTRMSPAGILLMGGALFNWPQDDFSRCTDCPEYLEHVAKASSPQP